ncbi:MAG: ParB N-terminal domain-containing protein [Proteobacteria bacterium]|nr:ParB N-terminal domain-containing protein [Pseudomonadota bacterium]
MITEKGIKDNNKTLLTTTNTSPLAICYLPISALLLNPDNPRIHSKKQIRQLAKSITEFGFNVPVLIDDKNTVIAGHGRVMSCKELGIKEVPVLRLEHLTKAQARTFMIADNKLTENAAWDKDLLSVHFKELSTLDLSFDLDITGFEMGEIDLMIIGEAEEEDENDYLPSITEGPAVSKSGDLWLLGEHRIYCGNSLESMSFEMIMAGEKAEMAFIDPPYNVPIEGNVSGLGAVTHREFSFASGEMSKEEFTTFLTTSFQQLTEYTIDGSIHYVCMDWRHGHELLTAGNACYTSLKNLCIWCKDNAGMGTFYRSQHELVYVFKHGTAPHMNNFELGQYGRHRSNVWNYPGANSFARAGEEGNALAWHPTVKPVAMVADAILDCSKRGGIILDSFLGSGTTLIASERTGRICYGIEIDPLYVDTAIRRWQTMTGQKAVHAVTNQTFDSLVEEKEANHE